MRRLLALALAALALAAGASARIAPAHVNQAALMSERPAETLAAYRLFRNAAGREPSAGVTAYELNTPLYSDGLLKFRYVFAPPGARASYREDGVFEFPVGTVLIKTFAAAGAYENSGANGAQTPIDIRFIETRLLIRRAEGWVALAYVWNEAQTEARYAPIGAAIPVRHLEADGDVLALDWQVPNRNQCKGCHDLAGEITPIGPTARNLNRGAQLADWLAVGLIDQAPADAPRFANAYDPQSGTVAERARAYLDVNCAHCHNPDGPAHTSGLDLRWNAAPSIAWGVGKRPTAAGRGSAGMDFAIEPGHPERSFLLHRMASDDPGVMMPELGRTLVDEDAIALMREWIAGMDAEGRSR